MEKDYILKFLLYKYLFIYNIIEYYKRFLQNMKQEQDFQIYNLKLEVEVLEFYFILNILIIIRFTNSCCKFAFII